MHNSLRRLLCLALLALPALSEQSAGSAPAAPPAPGIALAVSVAGRVTWRAAAAAPPQPLAPSQRLAEGAVVETTPGSTVTLVFFDGQRLALQPESRAVVNRAGLAAEPGRVRPLARVPAIVTLASLLRDGTTWRNLSGRVRGGTEGAISGLYPRGGAPVRRAAATFTFDPLPDVQAYRLTIEDEQGRTVLTREAAAPPVELRLEGLRPGKRYFWHVEPTAPPRPELRGDAVFATLDTKRDWARDDLARAASRSDEPDLKELLAEVDRALGQAEERPL